VDEREFTLTKGDLVILEPKVKHSYHSDKKDPVTKKWINFISEDFERMYHQLGLRNKIVFKNTNAEHYFDVLLSIAETSHYTDDICYDVASTLYSLIFEVAKKESLKENKKVSEVAKIIKERIDNAIFKKVNLDTICEITYYSKKQITREFKKYYGYTPYNYLITIKIDMAKRLLKSTNLSIKQIAYKLCFHNQHYFSKAFKKKTNMSPLEYRNNKK
jgi:AraC-like DNA-binding protein